MSEARKDLGRNLLDHITLINARSDVVQNLNCGALYHVAPQVIRTDHHPRRFELDGYPEVPGCASDWSLGPVYQPHGERWRKIPTRHSRFSRAAGNSTAAI